MQTLSYRRIEITRALPAAIAAAYAATELYRREMGDVLFAVIALSIILLALAKRFKPAYFYLATGWLFRPVAPHGNPREKMLTQLAQLNLISGVVGIILVSGGFKPVWVAAAFVLACAFTQMGTNRTLARLPLAAPTMPQAFVSMLRQGAKPFEPRRFIIGTGFAEEIGTPGTSMKIRTCPLAEARQIMKADLLPLIGLESMMLPIVAELFDIDLSTTPTMPKNADMYLAGDRIFLIDPNYLLVSADPATMVTIIDVHSVQDVPNVIVSAEA